MKEGKAERTRETPRPEARQTPVSQTGVAVKVR